MSVNTNLAVVEPKHMSYTPAEMRARSIVSRMASLCDKLKTLEDDIRLLWVDFENLKAGETILGCATKKEFCETKLNRTPRAIRYMLAGGNPDNQGREEIISPQPAPTTYAERPTSTLHLPNGVEITVGVNDYIAIQRTAAVNDGMKQEGMQVVNEKVVSVTGGRCDPRHYFVVTENLTLNKNHFDSQGMSYDCCSQIIGLAVSTETAENPVIDAEFADAPQFEPVKWQSPAVKEMIDWINTRAEGTAAVSGMNGGVKISIHPDGYDHGKVKITFGSVEPRLAKQLIEFIMQSRRTGGAA